MNCVFVLWHSYELCNGVEENKLLGIYSTEDIAITKISEYSQLPGFCDHLDGFEIAKYRIDIDHWKEGFFSQVD